MFGCNKNFFLALFVLIGTTVGAGLFGLPYATAKSGVIPALFYFLLLGAAMALVHLFYGEAILRTKEDYRLVGLARKYVGGKAAFLVSISLLVGLGGSLLVYIILAGDFLSIMLSNVFPVSPFSCSLIFWAIFTPMILRGLKLIAPIEVLTNIVFFAIIFSIIFIGLPKTNIENLSLFDAPNIFLPYGIILFSLVGMNALSEIKTILKTSEEKKSLKRVIIWSFLFMVAFYIIFTLSVVGMSGSKTSSDVFLGLSAFLGPGIIFFGALAAFITISDSFLIIALYFRNSLTCDYGVSKNLANLLVVGGPLVLFLLGLRGYIGVIGFLGTVIGAVEGVITILVFKNAKKLGNRQPEYSVNAPSLLIYILMFLFVAGGIIQFFQK